MFVRKVEVWYDAGSSRHEGREAIGLESGWVARCTEYDDGERVLGRTAMDEPIGDESTSVEEARRLAADCWRVDVGDVVVHSWEDDPAS